MVSNNLLWYAEPSKDMVKYEISCRFTIVLKCRHYLFPLREVVYNDNDVFMPPSRN